MTTDIFQELVVVKRSGQRVAFNGSKIAVAIKNAFDSIYSEYDEKKANKTYEKVLKYIEENYQDRKTINVEDIQDIIEKILKSEKYTDVYNSFNDYRKKRAASRNAFSEKQQHKFVKAVEKIIQENNFKNTKYLSPSSVIYKFGKTVSSEYAKSYILDSKYVRSHEEGNIFIHDLDYFNLGIVPNIHLKIEEKNINDKSLDDLIYEIIEASSEVNDEIAIDSIDHLLEPWLIKKYKDLLINNIKKYAKVTGLLEYINIKKIEETIEKDNIYPTNIDNYDTFVFNKNMYNLIYQAIEDAMEYLKSEVSEAIDKLLTLLESDGQKNIKYTLSTGTNYQNYFGKILNDNIIDAINNNPVLNKVTIIFKLKKEENIPLLNQISLLILNKKNIALSFVDSSYNIDKNEVEYFQNGRRVFENINKSERSSVGRMIINSTSINMARLGLKYENKSLKDFYTEFDELLDLVKNELLLSFENIGDKLKENYQHLFNGNIDDDEKLESNQKIRKVIKNSILNIGLVGLKECISVLETDSDKQFNLLIDIIERANKKINEFCEENKITFSLFEPSGIRARKELMAIDKTIYGNDNRIFNQDGYDLIYNFKDLKNDYSKLGKIQKLLNGGQLILINLSENTSLKKITDIITDLLNSDIGFVKIKVGKI